jgi:molybdopterin converting factor small subunit
MHVTVECLGASQRWCGAAQIDLYLKSPATVATAVDALAERYPEFAQRRERVAIAIGSSVVSTDCPLQAGDRIALIPPVSGG